MVQEEAMNMSNEQAVQILIPMRNMMCDQCPISDAVFALDKAIEALSIEKPQGEWIDTGVYAICSNCGANSGVQYDGVKPIPLKTRYCSNCGAKMKIKRISPYSAVIDEPVEATEGAKMATMMMKNIMSKASKGANNETD